MIRSEPETEWEQRVRTLETEVSRLRSEAVQLRESRDGLETRLGELTNQLIRAGIIKDTRQ